MPGGAFAGSSPLPVAVRKAFGRGVLSALVVAVTVFALVGCGAPGEQTSPDERPSVDVPAHAMSIERKTAELAEGFPFQVPVYDATVTSTQQLTPGTLWGYDLAAAEPAEMVAEWYRRAYAGANWALDREEPLAAEDGWGVALYLSKGAGAQSVITVRAEPDGSTSVSATVGLGAGIGETF